MSYSVNGATTAEHRTAAVLAHLSAIIAQWLSAGALSFLGPLIVWFMYKDRSEFVRKAAAGSFNFNLWAWVMTIVGWILVVTFFLSPVGFVLIGVAFLMTFVCHILGAVRASRGEVFVYPAQIGILR